MAPIIALHGWRGETGEGPARPPHAETGAVVLLPCIGPHPSESKLRANPESTRLQRAGHAVLPECARAPSCVDICVCT